MLLEHRPGHAIDFLQAHVIAPKLGEMLEHGTGVGFGEQHVVHHDMMEDQPPVPGEIDIHHLYATAAPAQEHCLLVFATANNDRAIVRLNSAWR